MRTSHARYLLASWWPLGIPVAIGAVAGAAGPWLVPEFLALSSPIDIGSVVRGTAWTLGFAIGGALSGFLIACMVCPPLFRWSSRRNGAPFQVGDAVLILARRWRNTVTTVVEVGGQGGSVRVELGAEARLSSSDWFGEWQLLRVQGDRFGQ